MLTLWMAALLLIKADDVETNPGPTTYFFGVDNNLLR